MRNPMGHEIPPLPETQKFFDDLVDARFEIADALSPLAAHGYETGGYLGRLHTLPEAIAPYIAADHSSDIQVGLSYLIKPGNNFSVSKIHLQPADGLSVTLSADEIATHLMVDGQPTEMFFG